MNNTVKLIDEPEMEARLLELPGWQCEDNVLKREYILNDFASALSFVNAVGALAEKANHHPDIDIRWNKVRLVLSTHSKGGLTNLDFSLAAQIEALP
jgi:4a-hydroxytetrahydrobiopterin dehydratase